MNIDLYQQRPVIDQVPALANDLIEGGFPATHYPGNPACFYRNSSVNQDDLPAGISHTWLLQERVVEIRPWGDPCNWTPLPETSEQALAENRSRGWDSVQILLADGSVWSQPKQSEHPRWKALRESMPLPAPDEMRQIPQSYRKITKQWPAPTWMWLDDPDAEEALIAQIVFDQDGVEESARIHSYQKVQLRSAIVADLEKIASRYPRIRVLHDSPLGAKHRDELLQLFPLLEYVNKTRITSAAPVDASATLQEPALP